jgi:hypothetical protein
MALSWNEIERRAKLFVKEWEGESRERAEKDSFWNDFFQVFGVSRRRFATFEEPVKKLNNNKGFIDLFWKGTLLVEHKSLGGNLQSAYEQATDYFHGLKDHELPKYILVSDFARFKLYDLDDKEEYEFELSELPKKIKLFGFVAGYQKREFREEDPVNIKAAELMGKLHDELEESGYEGHPLEVYLVRLLFCLFADDTGIFEKDTFREAIEVKTNEDGSNLGAWLAQFFQVLNTEKTKRLKNLDKHLAAFPYVNGKLFEESLPIAAFNSEMREILLECSALDWGKISPAIFGSMFQSVMDPEERRNLGAHYTSEKNILKVIEPLFLEELKEEFESVKSNKKKLREFHQKLGTLKFLDPACGCGNFLIITYRELRMLELEVLKELNKGGQLATRIEDILHIEVDQFFGIEYDEFPARIAEVAMWLMDHQMNIMISDEFGMYYARLPLRKSAKIVHGNALRIDWKEVVPKSELNYIIGNPPFYGKQMQTKEQKEDMKVIFSGVKRSGVLDYVSAWYLKAASYIQKTTISVAFVSTNSISQGEQTGILWNELFHNYKIKIHFAHRTFKWSNEAKQNAAVYCVIIGFATYDINEKKLFIYENIKGEAEQTFVKNINPYLVQGSDIVVLPQSNTICVAPKIIFGSMPNDKGNLLMSEDEKNDYLKLEPKGAKYIREFTGGAEFIRNIKRYCFWLVNADSDISKLPILKSRIQNVYNYRIKSTRKATRNLANFPTLFGEIRQPESEYILIPNLSSGLRKYIPIGFKDSNTIASNLALIIPKANKYHFGILTSSMHMIWVRNTCGMLSTSLRYSNSIVYNNYPWPKDPSEKNKKKVEEIAQKVLDTRDQFPNSSLADLYDPLTMPPALVKAHQELDKAVDLCYRPQPFKTETARIEFLFDLYSEYTSGMFKEEKKKKRSRRKK